MKNKYTKRTKRRQIGWFIIVFSLMMLSYPLVYNQVNRWYVQYTLFQQEKQKQAQVLQDRQRQQAQSVNQSLATRPSKLRDFLETEAYQEEIVYGTKVGKLISMGSVMIPSIDVLLPIYEGTGDMQLSLGAGHVRYSSYPIGGKSTHTVIAAHSGLVSGDYFLNLPKVRVDDYFFIKNKQEILAYQVFKIKQVKPQQIENIKIVPNKDLATLLTCVPIGINSDRLLVTGKRVSISKAKQEITKMQNKHRLLRKLANTAIQVSRQQVRLMFTLSWLMLGLVIYLLGNRFIFKR
ncbi:class C sortase [Enterococcus columbae]|uniref:Sortase n=1 Tax=Enterococcus columbae DSM 7374 = ATCC 51263 TaxID=1121865 RepID=S0K685_9ENTE|nr:class C sortase [Enterococcus columbae]EOT40569.1 hypothetical protein OMW_01431 [Enterococcus columbae DSM 7374 = ATCC 51263]EOW80345.1 hypothetical protein I568_02045 [Enterococcus columbae DSM 7374 = ATCC 51263]